MIFILRAPRERRLTASFGLSLTAAGIAIATLAATLYAPVCALARPSKKHHSDSSPSSSPKRVHKAMVRVETARLRSAPGDHHAPTALLDAGRAASVVARKGDWAKLKLATGRTGWVRADLLSISKKTVQVASAPHPKHESDSQTHHKKHQDEERHIKQVAQAKPRHKKPAPIKVAAAKPAAHKAHKPAAAKKPVQFAFSRPVIRTAHPAHSAHSISAPIVIKTTPTAPVSTASAVVAEVTQVPISSAPAEVTKESANAETPNTTSETVAPVQPSGALSAAETAAPVQVASAKAAPVVNRNLNRNERIARSALSYRGTPYRMGATGRGAFDCSGFMMYLFDKAGLQLPRTAAEQYLKGTPIAKDQLKPGDLVFFKNTYKHGVSHVGIYIGNGQFCHASSGGHAVRTDFLSKEYYVNHWAGARRAR